MNKKIFRVALITATLLAAGCGNQSKETRSSDKKDTIVLAQLTDPKTMEPHKTTSLYCQRAMTQIYDRLLEIDENMKLIPGLAESWEEVGDHTTVFRLREGVKFHNG